ncbi:hypothetical protein A2415_04580 [candidate division WWE3 bacterium RIFOXYC1_FULL_39_7]|uniref:Uncharacterized protein n=1 Tax=candidate division WWE3 bacterium RIFOXYC1_FULL_39_7 TaxID=1802643 RepID=A0A1F4WG49_UNCKA|nr:MAG: hypothetical protein A2415_04580 [candidate division WWE3 bacterium RIFOXYC1_FULL_39_7]
MDQNSEKPELKFEKNKLTLTETVVQIFNLDEAIQRLNQLRKQITEIKQKKATLEEYLKKKKWEEELEMINKTLIKFVELETEWSGLINPRISEIKEEIKKQARKDKIKRGYDRYDDIQEKINIMNQIIGPLASKFEIDMNDNIIMDIKKEFDKI